MSLDFKTIIALLMTVTATVFFLRSVWHLLTALESRSWPRTRGIVVDSKLEKSASRMYRARVSYRFTVDGREFVAERACFGDSTQTSWSGSARKIANRYHSGQAVTVHYHPEKPGEAVLEPGISGLLMTELVFLGLFLALLISML